MIEQINQELLKLQQELDKFNGAVGQVAKAGELSDNLIKSSKELQKSFGEQLNKIETLFSEFMNKTYSHTEDKINKIYDGFQKRLDQEEATLEKFSQLTMQNENLTQEYLRKNVEQNEQYVKKLTEEANATLKEQREYIKMQIEKLQKEFDALVNEHKAKLKTEQEVLENYIELAGATAELSKYLKGVDFKQRLDEIDAKISKINDFTKEFKVSFGSTNTKLDKLDEKQVDVLNKISQLLKDKTGKETLTLLKKIASDPKNQVILEKTISNNRKIRSTKFFVILIFIISLLFYSSMVFVFFTLFPHFFEDMF
jgi:ABC-type transporter Mla subunit MlaD